VEGVVRTALERSDVDVKKTIGRHRRGTGEGTKVRDIRHERRPAQKAYDEEGGGTTSRRTRNSSTERNKPLIGAWLNGRLSTGERRLGEGAAATFRWVEAEQGAVHTYMNKKT